MRFPSFFGLGLEDRHVPTFRSLLYTSAELEHSASLKSSADTNGAKNAILEVRVP